MRWMWVAVFLSFGCEDEAGTGCVPWRPNDAGWTDAGYFNDDIVPANACEPSEPG